MDIELIVNEPTIKLNAGVQQTGGGAVNSVNGKTGDVVLSYEDVEAASAKHTHKKEDITDFPFIPTKTSDLTNDSGFLTQHQDISGKQDVITDLDTIRRGAALGATAIQEHQDISGKVDKIEGKGLSTNDYTNEEKEKLNTAYNQRHAHINKTILDEITLVDINNWNNKYEKPEHGIPYSDLTEGIQTDIAILDNIQTFVDTSQNLVTSYAVYNAIQDAVGTIETALGGI